jgi:aminopeptidase N
MKIKLVLITSILAIGIQACKSKKNSSNTTAVTDIGTPAVQLDTLVVKPEDESPKKIYRATNPIINDILHTKLEVRFDWNNAWLFGKATLDIKPHFYPTKILYLNARGFDLKKVQLLKNKVYTDLKYEYKNDSIFISLDKEYTRSETYSVFIEYIAKPNELKAGGSRAITSDKGLYFINPKGEEKNKMPQIWTQGETQSNSGWMPCLDTPNEKMTNEILMTVDDKYTTLSNGDLISQTKNTDGTRTDHWKMNLPHSTYLIMMAVGEFKVVKDKKWNGKEINYYVEKEYEAYAKAIFGNTHEMIEFYSNKLGTPYPWSKYSQVVARDYISGAMENTTATLHGDFVYQTDRELLDGSRGEDVIAHELFHQWFGDLVTAESWSNLPLNESFATYGEYLWEEYKYGLDAADAHSYGSRLGYLAESSQKKEPLVRFYYDTREEMFDGHSYNKGGQILHMLRKQIGDDAFFAGLKLYLERNKFRNAEVHELRIAMEDVSGLDLNWFFNQWFYNPGHPEIRVEYSFDDAHQKAGLKVTQVQGDDSYHVFRLPLYVDLYFSENGSVRVQREKIDITKRVQEFSFNASSHPLLINFDAEKQLLCEKYEPNKPLESYLYQYKHAPKFLDRQEALNAMKGNADNPMVYDVLKMALKDKWYEHRNLAIKILSDVAKDKETDLKPLLVEIAKNDSKTKVRAEAIDILSRNYKGDDLKQIYTDALNEKSYAVIGAGLSALNHTEPAVALEKAKTFEGEDNDNIRFTIMDIYANSGDDNLHGFFASQKDHFTGFESIGYITIYSSYLKHVKLESSILEGAQIFADIAKSGGNSYVKYYAQKSVKDLYNHAHDVEDELNAKIEEAKKKSEDTASLEKELATTTHSKNALKEIYDSIK